MEVIALTKKKWPKIYKLNSNRLDCMIGFEPISTPVMWNDNSSRILIRTSMHHDKSTLHANYCQTCSVSNKAHKMQVFCSCAKKGTSIYSAIGDLVNLGDSSCLIRRDGPAYPTPHFGKKTRASKIMMCTMLNIFDSMTGKLSKDSPDYYPMKCSILFPTLYEYFELVRGGSLTNKTVDH